MRFPPTLQKHSIIFGFLMVFSCVCVSLCHTTIVAYVMNKSRHAILDLSYSGHRQSLTDLIGLQGYPSFWRKGYHSDGTINTALGSKSKLGGHTGHKALCEGLQSVYSTAVYIGAI